MAAFTLRIGLRALPVLRETALNPRWTDNLERNPTWAACCPLQIPHVQYPAQPSDGGDEAVGGQG